MKRLKQSWLLGETSPTSKEHRILGAIQLARMYFEGWTEHDVRELWKELNALIKDFLQKTGKKSALTNPIIILQDQLIMMCDQYNNFKEKWVDKFQNIALAKIQKVKASEVYLAAFILKNSAGQNIRMVLDAYSPLINSHNTADGLKNIKKSILSEQNRKNAQASRKKPIRKLIELFLNKNISKSYVAVINDLRKIDGNYFLKEIDEKIELWATIRKQERLIQTITKLNLKKMVSAVKTSLKKNKSA